jgi:hypothetical protein
MNAADSNGRSSALSRALGIGRLAAFSGDQGAMAHPTEVFTRFIAKLSAIEWATWRRIVEAGIMLSVIVLGFWGFAKRVKPPEFWWHWNTLADSAFSTLQLLTTQFPRTAPNDVNWQLQIARFFMPLFAVLFSVAALLRRFNRPLRAWTAGLSRDHVVLIGDSNVTAALAHAYRKAGRRVVAVAPPPKGDDVSIMEQTGARVIFGDTKKESVLRRAAIHRASAAIVADDVGTDAVRLAMSVSRLCRKHRAAGASPLVFLVRLGHRDLRSLLRTQIRSAIRESGSLVDLRLYVREQTLARSLLSRYPADWGLPPGANDIHAAIIGLGYMGGELLLQLARVAVPAPGRRCVFTVVDRDANGLKDQLLAANPGLLNCADELRFLPSDISPSAITADQVDAWFNAPLPATAIYVCCGDDGANLSMAIGLRKAYALRQMPAPPMFVYQSAGNELIDGLADLHGTTFDTLRVIPFGGVEEETDPFYLIDEEIDGLARLLHDEQYLGTRRQASSTAPSPAEVPWSVLDESYRAANRAQADHALVKLRTLGWHAVLQTDSTATVPAPSIDSAVLEEMAVQEHDRWCRERWLAGWVYDAKRNNAELRHPYLVPYRQLTNEVQGFDRDTVRELPGRLAKLGLGLRQDFRMGIWFEGHDTAPSDQLVDKLMDRASHSGTDASERKHVQLVLPLREPAELKIASALGRRGDSGVDVALVRSVTAPGGTIGARLNESKSAIGRMVAVADRAFTLTLTPSSGASGPASDTATVAGLCDVCDRVLLVCEEHQAGEAAVRQLDAARRAKVEIVAVQ